MQQKSIIIKKLMDKFAFDSTFYSIAIAGQSIQRKLLTKFASKQPESQRAIECYLTGCRIYFYYSLKTQSKFSFPNYSILFVFLLVGNQILF